MKHQYKDTKFRAKTLKLIEQANEIIEEYAAKGFELTVRQVYYQFIARNLLPNVTHSYNLVLGAIEKGRMGGIIDWENIVDRTRTTNALSHWDSPKEILESAASGYRLDTRATQDSCIEVWIEKNALLGVIEPICRELDVRYLACIGYYSLSAMWRAAQRFRFKDHKKCTILHLGDHDPSGIDMTGDIGRRLSTFGCPFVEVKRIALNMEQIEKYSPPPNPVKLTDTRSDPYIDEFGEDSWELDALTPEVVTALIRKNVDKLTDKKKIKAQIKLQEEQKERLHEIADEYED